MYVIVYFSVPQNLDGMTYATSWVRVGLLSAAEQSRLKNKGENLISLENIRQDAEEEVERIRNDLRMKFYIRWKQQIVFIQCSSIGPSGHDLSSCSEVD